MSFAEIPHHEEVLLQLVTKNRLQVVGPGHYGLEAG
jgi:hypothetical protein